MIMNQKFKLLKILYLNKGMIKYSKCALHKEIEHIVTQLYVLFVIFYPF